MIKGKKIKGKPTVKKNKTHIVPNKDSNIMHLKGVIIDVISGTQFKLKVENTDHVLEAYLCGKMVKNTIQVLKGDVVSVKVSPYDLSRGRIYFREH